jgi:hypothetical protein
VLGSFQHDGRRIRELVVVHLCARPEPRLLFEDPLETSFDGAGVERRKVLDVVVHGAP